MSVPSTREIKKVLEGFINKYGFTKELQKLDHQKDLQEITSEEYQQKLEELAQKLPLTTSEMDKLLELFERNIENMVQVPLIIGNGDIADLADIRIKGEMYNWDGGMIGRGVFENPFAFNQGLLKSAEIPTQDKLDMIKYHLNLWVETWGDTKNYQALKKFFKIYISGFDGAAALRASLMETQSPEEAVEILENYKIV